MEHDKRFFACLPQLSPSYQSENIINDEDEKFLSRFAHNLIIFKTNGFGVSAGENTKVTWNLSKNLLFRGRWSDELLCWRRAMSF